MSYVPGQPKNANRLRRPSRGIKEFARVLIACEGGKTEPNYFGDLCRALGLTTAVVEVIGKNCDSAPISVYEYAALRLKEDGAFDEVYCVFDRDAHETFDDALRKIASHRSKKMRSIVSYPCFEYWVLLHFRYTRGAMPSVGNKSCGDRMFDAVVEQWPAYAKGSKNVYGYLAEKNLTEVAINRSIMARTDMEQTGSPDPSTEVDRLVVRLRELGREFAVMSG